MLSESFYNNFSEDSEETFEQRDNESLSGSSIDSGEASLKLRNKNHDINRNLNEEENINSRNIEKIYRCINCSREVDDVLVLSCKHLMCLLCASIQLKEKYESYERDKKIEQMIEREGKKKEGTTEIRKHNIHECLDICKDKKVTENSQWEELQRKEKLCSIHCYVCDITNKITVETVEILTKIGLLSSDVLNVHTVNFNTEKTKKIQEGIVELDQIEKRSISKNSGMIHHHTTEEYNDTLNSDLLKNEDLKRMRISNSKYNELDERIDDLKKCSYICNICSYNEAVIYCKDCVEYLCEDCCNNIHELDILKKLKIKNVNVHDYYKIDKNVLHLKKLVKSPKKFTNMDVGDLEEFEDSLDELSLAEDTNERCNIFDEDSDFDKYDEQHFLERKKRFIEKEQKKEDNVQMSHQINVLVDEMKNDSSYGSENSSLKCSAGSDMIESDKKERQAKYLKKKKEKKKGAFLKGKKVKNANDIYRLSSNETKYKCFGEDGTDSNNENSEIGITNINNIQNKKSENVEKGNHLISKKDFTVIENIRCSEHFSYPIQYFCHSCNNKCFCSECAIGGTHSSQCEIENVDAAFITVLNKYLMKWNEIIGDLISDMEINFYEALEDTKNEWSSLLSDCYCNLNIKMNYIMNNLYKKESEVYKAFDAYLANFKKENAEYIELLNTKHKEVEEVVNIIRQNKYNSNPIAIIQFYRKHINHINKVIVRNNDLKPVENLSTIRESKVFYMNFYASQLISYLRYLQAFLVKDHFIC